MGCAYVVEGVGKGVEMIVRGLDTATRLLFAEEEKPGNGVDWRDMNRNCRYAEADRDGWSAGR